MRRECRTAISWHELTLFANGTLRLKEELNESKGMRLAELTPDEVEAYLRRLEEEDLSEVQQGRAEVHGDWVEACELRLNLPHRDSRKFSYGRFDSLPLALSRVNFVVDDMFQVVDARSPVSGLPRGYSPRAGDVLERRDGALFEVVGLTGDKRGVELFGLREPLTIYIPLEGMNEHFVAVVRRRDWP